MRLTALIVLLLAASAALAQSDTPRRKAGLWHGKQTGGGLPIPIEYRACVDRTTDHVVEDEEGCTKPKLHRKGAAFVFQSVCKAEGGGNAFQRVFISGDFDSAYTEQQTLTFVPPLQGIKESSTLIQWRWVAPKCTPGMSPGDVELIEK